MNRSRASVPPFTIVHNCAPSVGHPHVPPCATPCTFTEILKWRGLLFLPKIPPERWTRRCTYTSTNFIPREPSGFLAIMKLNNIRGSDVPLSVTSYCVFCSRPLLTLNYEVSRKSEWLWLKWAENWLQEPGGDWMFEKVSLELVDPSLPWTHFKNVI